jgi:hypothetical protein
MKLLAHLLVCLLAIGCASRPIEVLSLRTRPVTLDVEVESFTPPSKDGGNSAFAVTVRVLEERADGISKVRLVITDIASSSEAFLATGSRWRIHADEELFDHQKALGFSFWTLHDLSPVPLGKRPNQTPEPTPLAVTPRACARVAPSSVVAHL